MSAVSLLLPAVLAVGGGGSGAWPHCWDRSSCLKMVDNLADAHSFPRSPGGPEKWGMFWAAVVTELRATAQTLPDHGGDAAPPERKADPSNYCGDNGPYEFIPIHVGTVFPNSTAKLDLRDKGFTPCYETMQVEFSSCTPEGACGGNKWGYVHFTRPIPRSPTCSDLYGVSTKFGNKMLDISVPRSVVKPMHINYTYAEHEFEDITQNGLAINVAPCGLTGTVASVANTGALFAGSGAPERNVKFMEARGLMGSFTPFNRIVPIDFRALIKSGDTLAVLKLDGLDPLIAWGTGGRTGHTTIAVWEGGQLYVCESTDASPTGAYWPPPYGVIRTPWETWLELANKAGFSVDVLPLSPATSAAFNESAHWEWFRTVQGMPYGYHVMLFSFLDTHPNANLPKPMDDRVVESSFRKLDQLFGHDNKTLGPDMYSLIIDGLNHRLGTSCAGNGSFACMSYELLKRNMTYPDATSIPEDDDWRYDASGAFRGNVSMMCSAFVAHAFKVALGAQWPRLNAHEFTPKDVYQLDIYDPGVGGAARFNATNCPGGLIADPRGAYCQLLGPYELPLNGYNSVPVTPGMNERCAAQWPDYDTERPC